MVTEKPKRKAPALTIRFDSQRQLAALRRAAKLERRSLNGFIVNTLAAVAEKVDIETAQKQELAQA